MANRNELAPMTVTALSSAAKPKPNPKPNPDGPIGFDIDLVGLVNEILDCYKQVTVAKEEQLTRRTEIRERSRVCIAAIEANTKEFEMALEAVKIERMKLVDLICDAIRQKGIDEESLKFCEIFLQYLTATNPMNDVGKNLHFTARLPE